jgi:hypothetical protein
MTLPRLLAALCLAAASTAAAPGAAGELEALVDRARAAPAEFAADALLRLAELPQWKPESRRALIEEAFRRAAGAQYSLKQRAASLRFRTGPAAFLNKAFAQDLDRDSLQCRAVRALLPLDRKQARELFREIPRPRLRPATCDNALVYDVSAYYATLAELAASAFTPAEAAEDEPFKLLSAYLQGLQSPVEAGPVAHLLAIVPLKPEQLGGLVMSFAGALKELAGDDRSFSFTVSRSGRTGEQIGELAARCTKLDISAIPLIEAYRAYLVRHMGGERCADSSDTGGISFGMAINPNEELAQDTVRYFNERLRPEQVKAIGGDEIQPAKLEGAAGGTRSCEGPECQQLVRLYTGLVLGPNGMPYGPEKRATGDWQAKLKEYLARLAEWKDDPSATTGEHFQQKCLLYSDLFNIVPNGPDRIAILRAFLEFLQRNSFQRESRLEWFLPVNSLVARVSLDPGGLGDVLRDLSNSPDPVISLYTALEQVAPRSPGARLSIM